MDRDLDNKEGFTVKLTESEERKKTVKGETFILDDSEIGHVPDSITGEVKNGESNQNVFKLPRKAVIGLKALFVCFAIVVLIKVGLDIYDVYETAKSIHRILAGLFVALVSGLGILFVFVLLQYLWNARDYKDFIKIREKSKKLIDDKSTQEGKVFVQLLKETYEGRPQEQLFRLSLEKLPDYSNGSEVIAYLENNFYQKLDQQALSVLTKASQGNMVTVAISPWASVDMLFMFTRNIILMEQIAQIYGIQPSFSLRVRLVRIMFSQVVAVGAEEILNEALSQMGLEPIVSRAGTGILQGVSAGFFTSRVGIVAMKELRPIPFTHLKPPSLSNVIKEVSTLALSVIKKALGISSKE